MNDTQILKIIKNNIIFIVAFSILLLLYIIYLCYEIYKDSQKVKKKYVTKCPDYWDIGEENPDECTAATYIDYSAHDGSRNGASPCKTDGNRCVSFAEINKKSPSEKHKALCHWLSSNKKYENISWDSLRCNIKV